MSKIKTGVTAGDIIAAYMGRGIAPDETHAVQQGTLLCWDICGRVAVRLQYPSGMQVCPQGLYYNTVQPQVIADDAIAECCGQTDIDLIATVVAA